MPQNSVHVRLTPKQRVSLDDWRRAQPDLPTPPEALRRTLAQAIEARKDEEAGDTRQEAAAT
jgi:hypothetical protein